MATHAKFCVVRLEDGTILAKTSVWWDRTFGRCNRQTFSRRGEIYTRSRLVAWAKKYGVEIPAETIAEFPVKAWWQ